MKYPYIRTNDDNDLFIVQINENKNVRFRLSELLVFIDNDPCYIINNDAGEALQCITNWINSKYTIESQRGVHPLETEYIHSIRVDTKKTKHPLLYLTIDSGVKQVHHYRFRLCQTCLNGEKKHPYDCNDCSKMGVIYNKTANQLQKYLAKYLKLKYGKQYRFLPPTEKQLETLDEMRSALKKQMDKLIPVESRIMD